MAKIKIKYHDFEMEVEGSEEFVDGKSKDFPTILDKLFTYGNKITIESATKSNIQVPQLMQKNERQTYYDCRNGQQ